MISLGAIVVDPRGRRGTVIEVVRDYARVDVAGEPHWYACAALREETRPPESNDEVY